MCVIVHQPNGAHLSKNLARELWQTNPDGGGFAFLDNDKNLVVEKFMKFSSFWSKFETMRSTFPARDFMLHMRIATHGSVSINNVHPFQLNEHTMMAHNGILHEVTDDLDADPNDDRTDSEYFIQEVLKDLPRTWLDNKYLRAMMDEWIGWSRLMFITNDPLLEHTVYRIGNWEQEQGLMLSNINHLYQPPEAQARGWEMVNMGVETTEQWEAWNDYNTRSFQALTQTPAWELDLLLKGLKEERATMYIKHPLIIAEESIPVIECGGCLESINLESAECGCWDKACTNCMTMLANCGLQPSCNWDSMQLFDNLTEGVQNEILGIST